VAYPVSKGLEGHARYGEAVRQAFSDRPTCEKGLRSRGYGEGWWSAEPAVGRVAHGIPKRVDRLRSLGNAVVPQVVEIIGRAILAASVETGCKR
jgi:site-specific DNA-cytosine methylase